MADKKRRMPGSYVDNSGAQMTDEERDALKNSIDQAANAAKQVGTQETDVEREHRQEIEKYRRAHGYK